MDFLDSIALLRVAFQREHLKPPTTILLESHDEGMRFLQSVRQTRHWVYVVGSPELGKPIEMADGTIWMQVELMGIKVRWPANQKAMPDGSWLYV